MVAVYSSYIIGAERLPSVLRDIHRSPEDPNPLVVVGINADLAVIHGPRIGARHLFPGQTLILRAKNSTVFVFDNGIDNVGAAAVNIYSDAPRVPRRKSVSKTSPCFSAICRPVKAAARSSSVKAPASASPLIGCGIQNIWILMIQDNIHKSRISINKIGIGPGFSAILGSKQTSFFVRTP